MNATTRRATLTAALLTATTLTLTGCQDLGNAAQDAISSAAGSAASTLRAEATDALRESASSLQAEASNALGDVHLPHLDKKADEDHGAAQTSGLIHSVDELDPEAGNVRPYAEIDTPAERVALARKVLPTLPVLAAAPNGDRTTKLSGYERDCDKGSACVFGPAWTDDNTISQSGHNGCDTRNDVLAETLENVKYKSDRSCTVVYGTYTEPYFGTQEEFSKGEPHDTQDEVDHVIALRTAWDTGAATWSQDKRVNFANDTELNLLLTTRAANSAGKDVDGDGYKDRKDLGEYPGKLAMTGEEWLVWMDDQGRKEDFAARYVLVAERYGLAITEADAEAFQEVLGS